MNDQLRHFKTNDFDLVLTPEGIKQMQKGVSVKEIIKKYGDSVKNCVENEPERMFIRGGGNGDVFGHMGEYAVKEVTGQTSYFSLGRMERIEELLSKSPEVQRFARVPKYYGLYIEKEKGQEYLMMERIGSGLRVQDVIDGKADISEEIAQAILADYAKLADLVSKQSTGLFTDFHEGNVLVDFSKNTNGQSYTLVVVDQ